MTEFYRILTNGERYRIQVLRRRSGFLWWRHLVAAHRRWVDLAVPDMDPDSWEPTKALHEFKDEIAAEEFAQRYFAGVANVVRVREWRVL